MINKLRKRRKNIKHIKNKRRPKRYIVIPLRKRIKDKGFKILVLSSLIFITNIITSFVYKRYLYLCLFIFLTLTSVIYHSNTNNYTNILDKIGIFLIVSYGTYNVYTNFHVNKCINISIIFLLFLLTMFLYIYGYLTKQFCFNKQLCIGNKYHSLLHCISSLAHHLIIIM
jgi:hypothetical protein